jgi:hypothetical protein
MNFCRKQFIWDVICLAIILLAVGTYFYRTTTRTGARVLFVSPNGSDWNLGISSQYPLKSIQLALDHATPGSTVTLLPGTYHERIHIRKSGTPHQPVTLNSAQPGTAIVTNESARFILSEAAWKDEGNGLYSCSIPYDLYWLIVNNACAFNVKWGDVSALIKLTSRPHAFPAFKVEQGRLYLWLPNGQHPDDCLLQTHTQIPQPREWGEYKVANAIVEADHVIVDGIRFQFGIGSSVNLWNASNITLRDCSFEYCNSGVTSGVLKPSRELTLTRCIYHNFPQAYWEQSGWLSWFDIYARYSSSSLVRIGYSPTLIENNAVIHGGDAIGVTNPAEIDTSSIVRRNWIFHCTDDAFEFDGPGHNIHVLENLVFNTHESLGISPVTDGPLLVQNNLFVHPQDGINGAQIKLMGLQFDPTKKITIKNCDINNNIFLGNWLCWWDGISIQNVKIHHNYFLVNHPENESFPSSDKNFPPGTITDSNRIETRVLRKPLQDEITEFLASEYLENSNTMRNVAWRNQRPGPSWWQWESEIATRDLTSTISELLRFFPETQQ